VDKLKKDIALTLEQYPKLALIECSGKPPSLKGQIDIVDDGIIIETFDVLIQYTDGFPNCYPLTYETGGRFSQSNYDLHINSDGTLCLNVEQEEALETRNGITTNDFIRKVLIPNLAWRLCRLEGLTTELKEYRHGILGIIDRYKEILKTDNVRLILVMLARTVLNQLPERNDLCFCGGQRKYKLCHQQSIESLKLIRRDLLIKHFKAINETLKE